MVPSTTLANLSNTLFTTAIAIYSLAMVCFCGEYAFGRRGRVARTSVSAVPAEAPVLVGAGGTSGTLPPADRKSPIRPTRRFRGAGRAAGRFGRAAIGLTVLGALLHAASISIRGAAVDRVPWGNMYEFSSAVGLVAVVAFVVLLVRQVGVTISEAAEGDVAIGSDLSQPTPNQRLEAKRSEPIRR